MAALSQSPLSLVLLVFLVSSLSFFLIYLKAHRNKKDTHQTLDNPKIFPEWAVDDRTAPKPAEADGEATIAAGGGEEDGEQRKGDEKRRKKRGKKKRGGSDGGGEETKGGASTADGGDGMGKERGGGGGGGKGVDCPFPFSSFASAMQRRIKLQYDELVKSNQAKGLTMAQVGQFINCLVEARNELQRKSEIIQRSFKIKKALLFKADRSSFDRLCQQIYKLEAEHKRLEEDAAVYNLLQEQLKLSPAYKTMLEVGASMEMKAPSEQAAELPDISFEELLAQEKKDSFWQRNGKLRTFAS
ncbi:uncharacterized protein [Typha latifolia]|uniref:uncharacterized protein n=1 Tax=Typha latifolia TaxID=4733 RepID=UPI003C2BB307